ncbi:hypothetical protein EDD18DRAFT_1115606 [Armillaria luteobubalina]|uniref:Uncharacterized protein n=1 Tax=Armillaria luteobubalina TaxID=153913 RepID=A0AA39TAJ7_9AGAR|nr:hypothetical protein EDD18DRAFT_1115606 [Armillaria luteobubalina]
MHKDLGVLSLLAIYSGWSGKYSQHAVEWLGFHAKPHHSRKIGRHGHFLNKDIKQPNDDKLDGNLDPPKRSTGSQRDYWCSRPQAVAIKFSDFLPSQSASLDTHL